MEIFYFFAALALLGLAAYVLQIWAVRSCLMRKESCSPQSTIANQRLPEWHPVSILKPLKGLDDNLFDNLASFCTLDYPQYEIIFSLQDWNDPAHKVARKIKDKYPDKDISIIVERCNTGLNPKINNLLTAYKYSKYPYILISDSNVMVEDGYLKAIFRHMQNSDVGLVSNVIRGVRSRSIGSILENLHMNSFIVGSVCFLDRFLKMPCVVGKSMLMKKSDLEEIGGFEAVKDVLAEDYVIGKKMQKRGKKVILSNHLINNVNEYWGLKKFINRHTRWGKLRWKLGGAKYFSELLGNPVFLSCLPLIFCEATTAVLAFAVIVSLIKIIGDFYIGRITNADLNPIFYTLSPLKDLIIGIFWFIPLFSNKIVWRGNKYIIGKDTILTEYKNNRDASWRVRFVSMIRERFA